VRTALAVADYFRLSDTQARAVLGEVAVAVAQWRDVAARHQLSGSETAAMAPAFAALDEAAAISAGSH